MKGTEDFVTKDTKCELRFQYGEKNMNLSHEEQGSLFLRKNAGSRGLTMMMIGIQRRRLDDDERLQ